MASPDPNEKEYVTTHGGRQVEEELHARLEISLGYVTLIWTDWSNLALQPLGIGFSFDEKEIMIRHIHIHIP